MWFQKHYWSALEALAVYGQSCWNKLSVPRLDRVIVSGGRWWTSITDTIRDETNHLKHFGWKRPEMAFVWHIFHSTGEEPGKISANCVVALTAVHSWDSQRALIHSYLESYFVKHFFSAQTADSIHAIFVSWWPLKVKFWPTPHWFWGGVLVLLARNNCLGVLPRWLPSRKTCLKGFLSLFITLLQRKAASPVYLMTDAYVVTTVTQADRWVMMSGLKNTIW